MFLYAVFSMAGLFAAVMVHRKLEVIPRDRDVPAVLSALAGAVLGSQVPLWLSYGFGFRGKSFLGALLGGFLAVNLYKLVSRRRRESFGDNFAVGLALGAGFGKIGCYFNGCCGGKTCALPGFDRYPAQLLESAFNFLMAWALYRMFKGGRHRNLLFPLYALAYLVMRFLVEFLRAEPVVFAGLTAYQLLAVAFAPVFLLIIRRRTDVTVRTGD